MKILLLIFLLPFGAIAEMISYSVSPGIVMFDTIKGSVKSFDLSFLNQGDNKLNVNIETMDLTLDRDGIPDISKINNNKFQWRQYVQLSKKKFSVDSKTQDKVNILLKTPRSASGSGYFAVVFNVSLQKKANTKIIKDKNLMDISSQMPVLFIGNINRNGIPKIKVKKSVINKAPYTSESPLKIRFTLENSGTTHANVSGDVLLRHNGQVIERLPLESGSGLILPEGERYFVATLSKYKKYSNKKLSAEARFSYPGGRISKKINFNVK